MDKIEVYKHIIENEHCTPRSSDSYLDRDIKALFDVNAIIFCGEDTMPTLCQALLDSGTEMTQKFHTLARRGADGDTRWMFDSHGYTRVQYQEFYDRYVGTNAQYNAMRKYWLDKIVDRYENGEDDWRVSEDDCERIVSLVHGRVEKWQRENLSHWQEEAMDEDRNGEAERIIARRERLEARMSPEEKAAQQAEYLKRVAFVKQERLKREQKQKEIRQLNAQRAEEERQKRKEMRSLKKKQKVSYMISLMA